ncbi:TIGR00294 family protein [Aciduliprofundum sp. MAR08-339]|uniref:GTP cyclohydrolase MptA n=1 Tax=Aciduliprofundum sp. (strain MAR08-339) TaxID=673860 RepID=UPI0002A4B3BF|nr:TIGR00294 family protein [Aciduliprofundum sp. MAR08-339]
MYPDVQGLKPEKRYKITRVGVKNVVKPIFVRRDDQTITLVTTIDIFVDLPPSKKGSDMSRNIEVISEIVEESIAKPCTGIENLASRMVKKVKEKHEYSTYAEVNLQAEYFLERHTPLGRKTIERYRLIGRATMDDEGIKKMIGVEVVGMTACPCAMETVRAILKEKYGENIPQNIPVPTHNQRNIATVMLEVPEGYEIEANDLIDIIEGSMSSPTYEILKRRDEGEVVIKAHENPRFVEDVVREILHRILKRYRELPDETMIIVRSESEESIHKHNAFAERITTLGELRE